jgi:hypothetical protein
MCSRCGHKSSVTAGTIFDRHRISLRDWFIAAWCLTELEDGISALSLQKELGLETYQSAWTLAHKLRSAMTMSLSLQDRLYGNVVVDRAYVGGIKNGVRSRQSNKGSIVAIATQIVTPRGLEGFEQEVSEERKRHQLVLQALQDVEAENRSLREELRRRGKPDPASWTLKQEVFARNIRSLPTEIAITPGIVSVRFPAEDPACGARLLHELSLAMLNDWTTFCTLAGSAPQNSAANTVDSLLEDLEQQMRWGIANG